MRACLKPFFRLLSVIVVLCALPAWGADTVLVFGDSLSAGYGLAREQSWPALLAQRLSQSPVQSPTQSTVTRRYTVVNASISGETTAGGRARLAQALQQHEPRVVIIELGANDGLRGLPIAAMRDNLAAMIGAARRAGAKVLLVGMRLPPNYGPDYTRDFEATFTALAKQEKVALLPFLLEPIASEPGAFQPDGLHPIAAAQPRILDHLWPALAPLLKGAK